MSGGEVCFCGLDKSGQGKKEKSGGPEGALRANVGEALEEALAFVSGGGAAEPISQVHFLFFLKKIMYHCF